MSPNDQALSDAHEREQSCGSRDGRIHQRSRARRAAVGGLVGTFIEYYDFSTYGFLAVIIAPIFFPNSDPVTALLSTLLVFASAWLVRPFGGIFFGHIGDKYGRKTALLTALVMIGIASTIIGLLPTYAQVGAWSSTLLLLARLLQGFSTGGEVAGSITLISESVPRTQRAIYGSFTPLGSTLGFATGAMAAGIMTSLTTDEQMSEWGWRIPFLATLPLTLVCLWARTKVVETLEAPTDASSGAVTTRGPIRSLIADGRNRRALLQTIGLSIGTNATVYIGLTYLSIHLVQQLGYDKSAVFWVSTLYIALVAVSMILGGLVGDRLGTHRTITIGFVGFAVITYPAMAVMHINLAVATVACFLILVNTVFVQAGAYALVPRLFPTATRYSGVAMGWNVGAVLAGGSAPYIAVWLVDRTGNSMSPALFVIAAAVVGIATVLTIRTTADGADPGQQQRVRVTRSMRESE